MGLQDLSLVDRKKLQWQRERDEMAKLERYYSHSAQHLEHESNIDTTKSYRDQVNYNRRQLPTAAAPSSQPPNEKQLKNFANLSQEHRMKQQYHRSPSLPPIHHTAYYASGRPINQSQEDSGFTSDGEGHPSSGSSGEHHSGHCFRVQGHQSKHHKSIPSPPSPTQAPQLTSSGAERGPATTMEPDLGHETDFSMSKSYGRSYTPESMSAMSMTSYANSLHTKSREERARWNIYDNVYKEVKKDGPNWLEKGRDIDTESMDSYSFIRGQNAPIDPSILAERELKRKKALELQTAIKEQLEERERIKKIEREKQMLEERIEEERLMRQFEEEQHRLELEQKAHRTKVENERKKEELMRKAIERAALEARLEKERKKGRSSQTPDFLESPERKSPEKEVRPPAVVPDDDKVLIGTPIKLTKKDLRNRKKGGTLSDQTEESEEDSSVASPQSAISQPAASSTPVKSTEEGVALPVQSLIPIMPVQFANFGFAGSGSSLQLVMLAQPSFSSPFAMYQNFQNFGIANVSSPISPPVPAPAVQSSREAVEDAKGEDKRPESVATEELCQHCNKNHFCGKSSPKPQSPEKPLEKPRSPEKPKTPEKEEEEPDTEEEMPPSLPHEGTFTKEVLPDDTRLDVATCTGEMMRLSSSPRSPAPKTSQALMLMSDIGVQTNFECDHCFSHRASATVIKKERKFTIERTRSEEETTTTTTTTTIVKKKLESIQDRPKWGVRVPTVQYLKASERDPFRNRRRRFTKKMESAKMVDESSSSEAPRTPLRTKSHPISRNMCTELLPIKTDGNGKVYFVREKSFVINEALRANHHGLQGIVQEKILSRRVTNAEDKLSSSNDFDSIENSLHSSIDYPN